MKHLRFDGSIREPVTFEEALNDLQRSFRQLWYEIIQSLSRKSS